MTAWRSKELNFRIQELYEELNSVRKVALAVGLAKSAVHRRLQRVGLTKPEGYWRLRCCECEAPVFGKRQRCEFHYRVHRSRLDVDYRQRKKAVDSNDMVTM